MSAKINVNWHLAHPMPSNPSLDQRIAWHLEHRQACACREIPKKLLAEMHSRRIPIPQGPLPLTKAKELDFAPLDSPNPKIKFAFAKELINISLQSPETLYPHFSRWSMWLDSENQVLKWTAIDIIGRLAAIDQAGKVESEVPKLLELLHAGHLITTAHAIFALGEIARQVPGLRPLIIQELIAVGDGTFESPECREIAIGKVMEVLIKFLPEIQDSPIAFSLIQRACNSPRAATAKKGNKLRHQLSINTR
jgi:hypothetical protein